MKIESAEQSQSAPLKEHSKLNEFAGYPEHSGPASRHTHKVLHGKELHMGSPYVHVTHGKAPSWTEEFDHQKKEPLKVDHDGHYHVQPGDVMDSIARRALQDKGTAHPTAKELHEMEQGIINASEKDNPSLKHNPNFLSTRMKLTIPGLSDQAPTTETGKGNEPTSAPDAGSQHPQTPGGQSDLGDGATLTPRPPHSGANSTSGDGATLTPRPPHSGANSASGGDAANPSTAKAVPAPESEPGTVKAQAAGKPDFDQSPNNWHP